MKSLRLQSKERQSRIFAWLLIGGLVVLLAFGLRWQLVRWTKTAPLPWAEEVQAAVQEHDLPRAKSILLDARRRHPNDANVVQMLAAIDGMAGNYDAALNWLNQLPQESLNANVEFQKVQYLIQTSSLRDLKETLQRVFQLEPHHAEARRLLVELEMNMRRPNEMRKQVVYLDKFGLATALDVCYYVAGDRLRIFDPRKDVEKLEKMFARDPADAVLAAALADNYIHVNRRDEARSLLLETLRGSSDPEKWRLELGLAQDALDRGDVAEARKWLTKLPQEADLLPRAWLARARLARETGRQEEAVVALKNTARLDPFDPEPVYVLSQILQRQGQAEEASRLRERAEKLRELGYSVEDALGLDEAADPLRIRDIARRLGELDARREAWLCWRWLMAGGRFQEEAEKALSALEGDPAGIPSALRLPSRDDLLEGSQGSSPIYTTPESAAPSGPANSPSRAPHFDSS